ncbi:AAA family ATPase [Flavobacterium wongokense]|uniref:AAA family ATPase n=1 Tax=Flavobacterium wongokense TaxID=2910674 RepID=UPI001F18BDC0|nr:AAA family ATPase [Flavobacterium sp. WG47]MCF6131710.1 ATP-binding protein [Flavobacterium sp. WG47]
MRLSAIYIEDHFLFEKPETINLGGRYYYDISAGGNRLTVRRELNNLFIDNFFNDTAALSKLTLISAVVGQNGAGKSSILDCIRSGFVEYRQAFPHSRLALIGENDSDSIPFIMFSTFSDNIYLLNEEELVEKIKSSSGKVNAEDFSQKMEEKDIVSSIYYSPHFDYTYNENFDGVDANDISFDAILEKDLEDLENKESSTQNQRFSASQELRFKNSIRQLQFQTSELVQQKNIFAEIFNLPTHGFPKIVFRGHDVPELKNLSFHDTPYQFRQLFTILREKAGNERLANRKDTSKLTPKERKYIQLSNERADLKNEIINDLLSVVVRQMEKKNTFLEEGKLDDKFKERVAELSFIDTFKLFIKEHKIVYHGQERKPLPEKITLDLLDLVFSQIDKLPHDEQYTMGYVDNKIDFYHKAIYPEPDIAVKILNLHRRFIIALEQYYFFGVRRDGTRYLDDRDKIDGFINYEPIEKKLSSGENSLLNFFSRLYVHLKENFIDNPFSSKTEKHFILLLDEADLSFHPTWKKLYVTSLIKTIPYFFELIEESPSVQIIFTTHDPLALSDIPNHNIVFLKKDEDEVFAKVLDYIDIARPKSFGANVNDLLSHSFFVKKGLVGEFAKNKINRTINWLNMQLDNKFDKNIKYSEIENDASFHKKVIAMIDEPIVKEKLQRMYVEAIVDEDEIREEIIRLQNKLK